MLSISKLLPNEEQFFRFLASIEEQAFTSASLLKALVDAPGIEAREKSYKAIRASKSVAKRIANDTTRALCMTFVTPFDREDIQDLTTNLYKIPKTIEKVAEYLELYHIENLTDLSPQVELILQEATVMQDIIKMVIKGEKVEKVSEKTDILDSLEDKGDQVLRDLLVNLLKNSTDARQLILRKDIYDLLERIIDRYRDAAYVALKIVLKHS